MDRDLRNKIQRATQAARRLLENEFAEQLEGAYDIQRVGEIEPTKSKQLSAQDLLTREKLVAAIQRHRLLGASGAEAVSEYLREAAFTTLNRFVALKMLEARKLVQECVTQGDHSAGFKEFAGLAPGLAQREDRGYRLYIESIYDEIGQDVGVLFDRRDPAGIVWPRRRALAELLAILRDPELEAVWVEGETIGWVYQYFNSVEERKKMRDESGPPRNSRELAVRNQFFTPRYVVQFLVDNTLGRMWLEMYGDTSALSERCEFFVSPSDETIAQRPKKDPRDLRILDPACGSGHFLLYSFDLLLTIYDEAWDDESSAVASTLTGRTLREDYPDIETLRMATPALIVEHNLFGVEIDPR